ncbi:MAG: hypothetical protein EU532_07360 [Promethearchaeota archaeon]|nr:MAG: hypothetical protein EU532_07360 [Candidatus Lokiarchaeota archaeon]
MTYFKLIVGLDCGVDKSVCQFGYPENCFECLSKKFNEANFLMDIIEVTEQQSQQKRKEILYKHIWRKYQDISTIRHLIVLTKAGLPAFNMAIGDLPIDATLLSGFIQANISFSSEELTLLDRINPEKKYYEFEYKNFHLLLCIGKLCKICLILDKKPSNSLKELLSNFTNYFEENYKDELVEFEKMGDLSILDPVRGLVEKTFDIILNYPLTLASKIPPHVIDNLSLIQKAIYETAKELLKEDTYFFITLLINMVSKLLGLISHEEILWNIYQLLRQNLIIRAKLDFEREKLEGELKEKKERENIIRNIMEMKDLEEIIFECQDLNVEEANIKINSSLNKAEIAEKNAAYQEALYEYQKAMNYAKEFNMDIKIAEISLKISEIVKINNEVELNFAIDQANKSEKKKDYVIALKYLFQIKDIFEREKDLENNHKQLEKLENRIKKIQNHFK